MSTPYKIPLSAEPQLFTIQLGATTYWLTFYWSVTAACWMLDIADADKVPMIEGIPVVTGLDLLMQYRYLGFAGKLIVQTDFDTLAIPTFENLGTTGNVYFVVEP